MTQPLGSPANPGVTAAKVPDRVPVTLFTPCFAARTAERQAEFDLCLRRNLACEAIHKLVLLIDDGRVPPLSHPKLVIRHIHSRPTYLQWLSMTDELPVGHVSILANADIYFDETLSQVHEVLAEPGRLMALSRYEKVGDALQPHTTPKWSQDAWGIRAGQPLPLPFRRTLDIPLGVPRCDNKIAYLFAVQGWAVHNPMRYVRSVHVHETQQRHYDKKTDTTVMGGVAYVHPAVGLADASGLEFEVWARNAGAVQSVTINTSLDRWQAELAGAPVRSPVADVRPQADAIVAACVPPVVDTRPICIGDRPRDKADLHFWQYPAATERQAWENHLAMARGSNVDVANRVVHTYLAVPWASSIDKRHLPDELVRLCGPLLSGLAALALGFGYQLHVHTVCQHIHWQRLVDIFKQIGITDLHLSHDEQRIDAAREGWPFRVHSWPLFAPNIESPERRVGLTIGKPASEKRYLASFIGAHMPHYRSDVRLQLAEAARGAARDDILVELSNEWHFNKLVYQEQMHLKALSDADMQQMAASVQRYNEVLSDSIFSLCPDGAGPNTLRIWESLAVGAIPVVMVSGWRPPQLGSESARSPLEDCCIFWPIDQIATLWRELERIPDVQRAAMQSRAMSLYQDVRRVTAWRIVKTEKTV